MEKKFKLSLFIFRRDIRLPDNIGLIESLKQSEKVIPVFIFTPEQIEHNIYKSDSSVQFMIESLDDLNNNLKKIGSRLFYFFGKQYDIVESLIDKLNIDAVFYNRDYTQYAIKRDQHIANVCKKHKIECQSYEDYLLQPMNSILTLQGTSYTVFTPFYNNARKIKVNVPQKNSHTNFYSKTNKIIGEYKKNIHELYEHNDQLAINGGRHNAKNIIKNISDFKKYNVERNYLNVDTTRLSAYIKFGCLSIREVYNEFKQKLTTSNDLIKQLFWREFYYNVAFNHQYMMDKDPHKKNLVKKYNRIKWITYDTATSEQKKEFKTWCDGKTGIPIIDACMRELNISGFMHNRGRMIVASFLVKNLFWHWTEGEKYFATKLIDYDPNVNNGNWHWISGQLDNNPYFRVFNPWSQAEKYDKDCLYIKKWIVELKNVDSDIIHNWHKMYKMYEDHKNIKYLKPIVDASLTAKKAINNYKKYLS